jgi:hypothetical protein
MFEEHRCVGIKTSYLAGPCCSLVDWRWLDAQGDQSREGSKPSTCGRGIGLKNLKTSLEFSVGRMQWVIKNIIS